MNNHHKIDIKELLLSLWQSEQSAFYRTFWHKKQFNPTKDYRTMRDFNKIPILTKHDLLKVAMHERNYGLKNGYAFPVMSSGTTARPFVALHNYPPQTMYHLENWLHQKKFDCSSYLILRNPTPAGLTLNTYLTNNLFHKNSSVALGDIHDLKMSAYLAKELQIDYLYTQPTFAIHFAHELTTVKYDKSRIKVLHLSGEPLTKAAQEILSRFYPSALQVVNYSSAETNRIGIRSSLCKNMEFMYPNMYHLNNRDFIFEEVNGTVLLTTLFSTVTPLIRYNIEDQLQILHNFQCDCKLPLGLVGIVGPRTDLSNYKIGGAIFRADEVSRVLKLAPPLFTNNFTLQIEQIMEDDTLYTVPNLTLSPIDSPPNDIITASLVDLFLREFRIGKGTLTEGVNRKIMKPPVIKYKKNIKGKQVLPPQELIKRFRV